MSLSNRGSWRRKSYSENNDNRKNNRSHRPRSRSTTCLVKNNNLGEDPQYPRLVMLGNKQVGKTSLVTQYISNKFDSSYSPTIEDIHWKTVRIEDEAQTIEIVDLSGNQAYTFLSIPHIKRGAVFMLVFSYDDRESFLILKDILGHISTLKQQKITQLSIVICGNKCDVPESSRKVSVDEVKYFCKSSNLDFFEVSAKENLAVDKTFRHLLQHWREKERNLANSSYKLAIKSVSQTFKKKISNNETFYNSSKNNSSSANSSNQDASSLYHNSGNSSNIINNNNTSIRSINEDTSNDDFSDNNRSHNNNNSNNNNSSFRRKMYSNDNYHSQISINNSINSISEYGSDGDHNNMEIPFQVNNDDELDYIFVGFETEDNTPIESNNSLCLPRARSKSSKSLPRVRPTRGRSRSFPHNLSSYHPNPTSLETQSETNIVNWKGKKIRENKIKPISTFSSLNSTESKVKPVSSSGSLRSADSKLKHSSSSSSSNSFKSKSTTFSPTESDDELDENNRQGDSFRRNFDLMLHAVSKKLNLLTMEV
eukprot:Awhi_evm1s3181